MKADKLLAYHIVKTLQVAGYPTYIAGGAVRDLVMGKDPHDYDVATAASPARVQELFEKDFQLVLTGESFGVIRIIEDAYGVGKEIAGHNEVEVATFRQDGNYGDGRRPDSVEFVTDIETDLSRRDFTINAMALDPVTEKLIDPFKGKKDIRYRRIQAVGNPLERFSEDYLRMLRAIRFAARFGFNLHEDTFSAIAHESSSIKKVSRERIAKELSLTFEGYASDGLQLLEETGLLTEVLPGVPYSLELVDLLDRAADIKASKEVVWALLFSSMSPSDVYDLGVKLKLSTAGINSQIIYHILNLRWIVKNLSKHSKGDQYGLCSRPEFWSFVDFALIPNPDRKLSEYMDIYTYHQRRGNLKLGEVPLITGQVLIDAGMTPGPEFSEVLRKAKTAQIEGKFSTKEEFLEGFRK